MDHIRLRHEEAEQIWEALISASMFFEHRDRMNAAIHGTDVRFSPITESVGRALAHLAANGVGPQQGE